MERCLSGAKSQPAPHHTASVWQARQPIYRTSVERWKHYEPWLGELRALLPDPGREPTQEPTPSPG
jgi:hypothetical protein